MFDKADNDNETDLRDVDLDVDINGINFGSIVELSNALESEQIIGPASDLLHFYDPMSSNNDISTPNGNFGNPNLYQDTSQGSLSPGLSDVTSNSESADASNESMESADNILKKIRVKNVNRVIIGTLNINSLATKFEQLREIIGTNLDILTIQETKLDASFPSGQFFIDGYSEP